jgi:predicted acylesterase/phospholipase RssA
MEVRSRAVGLSTLRIKKEGVYPTGTARAHAPMITNLALSGGGHLCLPFLGFLRALRGDGGLLSGVREVSASSAGAVVALTFVLDLPDDAVIAALCRHLRGGFAEHADLARLLGSMGALRAQDALGPLLEELVREGVARWNLLRNGWVDPAMDPAALTLRELCQLTGVNLGVGVCDAEAGFAHAFLSCDTAPDATVVSAVCASCAIPLLFEPVRVAGRGGALLDSCVTDGDLVRFFPPAAGGGAVDTLLLEVQMALGPATAPRPPTATPSA